LHFALYICDPNFYFPSQCISYWWIKPVLSDNLSYTVPLEGHIRQVWLYLLSYTVPLEGHIRQVWLLSVLYCSQVEGHIRQVWLYNLSYTVPLEGHIRQIWLFFKYFLIFFTNKWQYLLDIWFSSIYCTQTEKQNLQQKKIFLSELAQQNLTKIIFLWRMLWT
jgi:hypothetical protein